MRLQYCFSFKCKYMTFWRNYTHIARNLFGFCIKILLKHANTSKCCLLKLSGAGASRPRGNFLELKTIARGRDALAPLNSA